MHNKDYKRICRLFKRISDALCLHCDVYAETKTALIVLNATLKTVLYNACFSGWVAFIHHGLTSLQILRLKATFFHSGISDTFI